MLEVTDAAKGKIKEELNNHPGKIVRVTMGDSVEEAPNWDWFWMNRRKMKLQFRSTV